MHDYLLQSYVERLSKEDVNTFATSQGIALNKEELDIIYSYLIKYWRTFYYGNPRSILEELRNKLGADTYNKIEALYIQAKERLGG